MIPGKVECEHYTDAFDTDAVDHGDAVGVRTNDFGVDIKYADGVKGNTKVSIGYTKPTEWLDYRLFSKIPASMPVDPTKTKYKFALSYAAISPSAISLFAFPVGNDDQRSSLGTFTLPATGGFATYSTFSTIFNEQMSAVLFDAANSPVRFRILFETGSVDVDSFTLSLGNNAMTIFASYT